MEYINKVILRGIVGNVKGNGYFTRFTLVTNCYMEGDGATICESTWHNILCLSGVDLEKGDEAEIEGRIRNQRYIDKDGNDRYSVEIVTKSAKRLNR